MLIGFIVNQFELLRIIDLLQYKLYYFFDDFKLYKISFSYVLFMLEEFGFNEYQL